MRPYFRTTFLWFVYTSVYLPSAVMFLGAEGSTYSSCSSSGHEGCHHEGTLCANTLNEVNLNSLEQGTKHIKFNQDVPCDPSIKSLLTWAQQHDVTIDGICASPTCLAGQRICELNHDLSCGTYDSHVRKRRSVVDKESNVTTAKPSGPGGVPVLPCDFDLGFCQWYQLSDSDFKWTRHKGATLSSYTGPSADHTTGKGYYIYIETSLPRKLNDKARLVSPTLRPVEKNQTCTVTFYVHMYGDNIGKLNVYQAPVVGHDVIKKSLTSSQGNAWVREDVTFDSDREFQVIFEGVRGASYRGDIALDDISFTSGCQRLEPAFVRLVSQNNSNLDNGNVEVYNNGTWGRVCKSGWTNTDSDVTCKELGFTNTSPSYGSAMASHVMRGYTGVSCIGSERTIRDCPKMGWSHDTVCTTNQTASLKCSGIAPVCPLKTHFYCPKKTNEPPKCISMGQRCDYINDCWDGSDEMHCGNYTQCDFEDANICGWLQVVNDHLNWTRHRGSTPSQATGPDKDHNGDANKYYLYVRLGGRLRTEKGKVVVTPRFQGNHEGLCKVRFFYHMYGWDSGTLRVLIRDLYTVHTVWEKVGTHGPSWNRAEITLINTTRSFQVMFEAEHTGNYVSGDIAIDDVSFTPECRPAPHENVTCKEGTFKCTSGECIPMEHRCDFKMDCFDGFDERNCGFEQPGRCNFEQGFCDWQNETGDVFDFERQSGYTPSYGTGPHYDHTLGYGQNGHYLYIEASSPRVRGDIARLAGPQFMWRGIKGCKIRFFYHMWSLQNFHFVGTLKVLLRNVITRETVTLWQRTGSQGNYWRVAGVPIATNWSVSQVVLEASVGYAYQSDIAVDDISFTSQCYPDIPAHVDKNYDVRLVGKKSSFQGRVEVFRVGYWGTVCSDGWDKRDKDVVCKQLGYSGAVDVNLNTLPGKGQIWLDNLRCFGNESNLDMCGHNGWSVHNCDHNSDATAVCSLAGGSTIPLRLSGYNNDPARGVVEVYYNGVWGAVCFDEWDLHDAHVVCRQTGFLGLDRVTNESSHSAGKVWLSRVRCQGNEDSLGKCNHAGWGAVSSCKYGYAGVVCKQRGASEGDVRLVGGRSAKEGRVEIYHRGEWGTVCEENWDLNDAQVVCFELGFTSVLSPHQSFGPGTGRIWLHNVRCNGTESALSSCPHNNWGLNPCTHHEDVGIICGDTAYVGCYKDNDPRVMPHKKTMKDLTPVKCMQHCRGKGFSYAGLEWSTECYCGNFYNKYGNASNSECSSPCVGNPSKQCGGPWRLSVYATNPAILPSSAPGWMPVRQSCSSVSYWGLNYIILNTIQSPNYFSGNHTTGYIWSPSFPKNYPNSIYCVWVLNLHPGTKARISFESFDLEDPYDSFEARDGKREFSSRLTPLFGFTGTTAHTITASSNAIWLKFFADETVNEKGFKLRYDAIDETKTTPGPMTTPISTTVDPSSLPFIQKVIGGCNGQIHPVNVTFGYFDSNHNTGYIKSPGYPGSYGSNKKCNWTIVVQSSFVITVKINELDLSSGDVLYLGDGLKTEKSSEKTLPWRFTSRDRLLQVAFLSSGSRRKRNIVQGFYMTYERENPNDHNGSADKQKDDRGLSGGSIAGIIVGFIVLICIILILVFLLIKNKQKRSNQAARHCFVNRAYDNTDGMAMANAGPTPPSGLQDASIFYANVAVAPPPYTPQDDSTSAPAYATPTAPDNQYANIYSHPPPYRPTNDPHATTTSIGSVTNLRDAPPSDGSQPVAAVVLPRPVTVLPPIDSQADSDSLAVKSVLPPIGGQDKTPLPSGQAGPLPEKVPIDVASLNPDQPTTQLPNRLGPLDGRVARTQASTDFDVEVPFEFICPISNDIMKHPVSASDGYTYERRAIKSWFRRNRSSPMTNERMTDLTLRPNEHLEARIKEFVQAHSKV